MAQFGVTPQGFAHKRLPDILSDIETDARAAFGAGVIQTPQSPLGQWNGLASSLAASVWELALATYQSLDPDQAEGVRLDMLARLRLIERIPGETDEAFRSAITNAGRARIDLADIYRAVRNVSGVTWAKVWVNDTATTDANGIPANTIAIAAIGGLDADIVAAARAYVVPGIGAYGNVQASATLEGFCRSMALVRPAAVPVKLALTVSVVADRLGCPPPTSVAMAQALVEQLSGDVRPANGEDIDLHMLQMALSCRFPNVRITAAQASIDPAAVAPLPLAIGFFQIAAFDVSRITITVS
jgi:hypothetical protein